MRAAARMGALLAASLLAASPARAQGGAPADSAPPRRRGTGVLLPGDHWAAHAVRRLAALGAAGPYLAPERAIPSDVAGEVLCGAADEAASGSPAVAALAGAWCARFQEEFPAARRVPGLLGSALRAGYAGHRGAAAPGTAAGARSTGAAPLDEVSDPAASARVALALPLGIDASAEPVYAGGRASVPRWNAWRAFGPVGAAVRRAPVGYGFATSGVMLSEGAAFTQVTLETLRPVRLPGVLGRAGPVAAHVFGTRLHEERHPGRPFLTGINVALMPHPRLVLEARRAALVVRDTASDASPLLTFFQILGGGTNRSTNNSDNQFASAELRYRVPTDRWLPVTVYTEWGAEDFSLHRAFVEAPAYVIGGTIPAVPGLAGLQLGAERTSIGAAKVATYRHPGMVGGWVSAERPLGRALGGHGTETLVFASLDVLDARVRMRGEALRRWRGAQNLYVPGRAGTSRGAGGSLVVRACRRCEIQLSGATEAGQGWSERRLETALSLLF